MKRKHLTGIALISALITLFTVAFVMNAQGEMVKSLYIKLAFSLQGSIVALAGIYLIDVFKKDGASIWRKITFASGALIILLSFLVSFNIINFLSSWNWLVVFIILYILLVQIQLLNWKNQVHIITRTSTFIIIICDLFLALFFSANWHSYKLEVYIELSAVISIVFTFIGLIFLPKSKQTNS